MTEQQRNKRTQEIVEAAGGYIVKIIVANKAGTHDMIACINGRFCSLEGKLKYNKMSDLQLATRNSIIKAGGIAAEIKTDEDVERVIYMANNNIKQFVSEGRQLKSFEL